MQMMRQVMISAILSLTFASSLGYSWSHHDRLTEISISSITGLQTQMVQVTPFSEVEKNKKYLLQDLSKLKALKYQDMDDFNPELNFNENVKINKTYVFKTETVGSSLAAATVLKTYANEPDWGMDQLLFNKDQYPQIWRNEYNFMGGSDPKDPIPTQAFRHMYWEGWTIKDPASTFKLPFSKELSSMGQAPDRGALFYAISLRARELHMDYWAYRFLAVALHYMEDVSQPYHSTQTPTKRFWFLPFTDKVHGDGLKGFVIQGTHILTYYHFNFENYVAILIEKYFKAPTSTHEALIFISALSQTNVKAAPQKQTFTDYYDLIKKMSVLAVDEAPKAGSSSLDFFPGLPPNAKFATFDGVASTKYMDDAYWAEVFKRGEADTPEKAAYFEVVSTMFKPLGAYIRQTVLDW